MSSEVVQVVDESGSFNDHLEDFVQRSDVGKSGTDYQIIAITGPQSSGKSTLMNVLVSGRLVGSLAYLLRPLCHHLAGS